MKKNILVVAKNNKAEALRVAVGLVLLDDAVKVDVMGLFDDSPPVQEQLEVLEFADVPCELLDDQAGFVEKVARDLLDTDVVYVI